MQYHICYDISNNKKRRKVAELLSDYGVRVQYSVFRGELKKKDVKSLLTKCEKMIDVKTDSVMFIPLCANCESKTDFIGTTYSVVKLNVVSDSDL
jgi:CRISPR-associated protein Cas2